MTKPIRIQLSRKRGFELQAKSRAANGLPAVNVARPTKWGNPFVVGKDGDASYCVELHRNLVRDGWIAITARCGIEPQRSALLDVKLSIGELRGHNLACWCKAGKLCHADVLLEMANAPLRCEAT